MTWIGILNLNRDKMVLMKILVTITLISMVLGLVIKFIGSAINQDKLENFGDILFFTGLGIGVVSGALFLIINIWRR